MNRSWLRIYISMGCLFNVSIMFSVCSKGWGVRGATHQNPLWPMHRSSGREYATLSFNPLIPYYVPLRMQGWLWYTKHASCLCMLFKYPVIFSIVLLFTTQSGCKFFFVASIGIGWFFFLFILPLYILHNERVADVWSW